MGIASPVQICNNALLRIGARTIVSFTDGTTTANLCNSMYDPTRRMLLRKFLWNFAAKRVQLAASSTTPLFEYNQQYQLPSDFIRVSEIYQQRCGYQIEESLLLTNDTAPLNLKYISDWQDTTTMDDLFIEVLTLMLAIKFGWRITGTGFQPGTIAKELEMAMADAKLVSSQDQTPKGLIITEYEDDMFTGIGPWFDPTQQGMSID